MRYQPRRALRNSVAVANTWLTKRQHRVLSLYASGCKRASVASKLGISPRTVERHLALAMVKLECSSIHQAVAIVAVSNAMAAAA